MQKLIPPPEKVSSFRRVNKLNELSGRNWIKFTKTWFMLRSSARDKKIYHPASFPEELAHNFITFFTKSGDWVLDPFVGSGSSLIAAKVLNRNAIGVELYSKYVKIAEERLTLVPDNNSRIFIRLGDARNLIQIFNEEGYHKVDFCITSPPYWNQLKRNNKRQRRRAQSGLDTNYGSKSNDLGNIDDYDDFLKEQELVFDQVFQVTREYGYLVVVTNNVYVDGRIWPLAFDTFKCLSKKWVPKDERIWCQNDKSLYPFGIFNTYVGNRAHHYCLIFQKRTDF